MRPLLLVLLLGCVPAASVAVAPDATIAFAAPPGSVRDWSFDVHGLPAIDTRSGEILVADVARANLSESRSLAVLSLRAGSAGRALTELVDAETLGALFVMESPEEEARVTTELAGRARLNTRAANRELARRELRPLETCRLPAGQQLFCTHPQQIVCGTTMFEVEGDSLRWRGGAVRAGWSLPPMEIGDGPPKEMLACIEEAHLDPVTMQLAVRLDHVCEGGGSDACILPDEWHVVALR